jgi:outer membrane immunogenic protein
MVIDSLLDIWLKRLAMKRFFAVTLVFSAAVGLTQFASAGPEPLDAKSSKEVLQPALEQPCNWTGFYIGAHVGYGWGDLKWTDTDTSTFPDGPQAFPGPEGPEVLVEQSWDGVIAGGQLGYNYQFGHFVIGAEGEFSFSDVGVSSSVHTESFTNDFKTNSDWVGTFGLRVGYAWNHFLFYAKGGGAVTHQEYSLDHTVLDEGTPFPVDRFKADETRIGPMIGGGIEYALTCHWSVKAEYTCLFLGKDDITGTNVEAGTGPESESYEADLKKQNTVRVGLNYKF